MKLKIIIPAALLIAGLTWIGRDWYDARRGLVTLHANDLPLAEVLAKLSKQSGRSFVIDKRLEGKLTLDLKRVPIDEALDQVMQQAGGNWSAWHAIHQGNVSLGRLETALRDHAPLDSAGWTNLAPAFEPPPELAGIESVVRGGSVEGAPEGASRRVVVEDSGPVVVRRSGGEGGDSGGGARVIIKRGGEPGPDPAGGTHDVDVRVGGGTREVRMHGSGGGARGDGPGGMRVVTFTRDGSGKMTQEVWSPEVVSIEKGLASKLGEHPPMEPDIAAARAAAAKVDGKVTTLYVLKKMPEGLGLPPGLMTGHGKGGMVRTTTTGDGKRVTASGDAMPQMESVDSIVNRTRAENFNKLTPEQRVRQAQERQAAKTNRQENP